MSNAFAETWKRKVWIVAFISGSQLIAFVFGVEKEALEFAKTLSRQRGRVLLWEAKEIYY